MLRHGYALDDTATHHQVKKLEARADRYCTYGPNSQRPETYDYMILAPIRRSRSFGPDE